MLPGLGPAALPSVAAACQQPPTAAFLPAPKFPSRNCICRSGADPKLAPRTARCGLLSKRGMLLSSGRAVGAEPRRQSAEQRSGAALVRCINTRKAASLCQLVLLGFS